jgi:integrase
MNLNARTVAALKLDGKTDAIHWDSAMPRFGFRVRRGSGGKLMRSWVVQYRRAGGHRRITLGSAEVLSAEAARKKAKEVLAKVELGDDPQADRHDRRDKDRLRLRAIIDDYLAVQASKVRPTSMREIIRYLTGPYFKPLHNMPIDTVTRRDVAARVLTVTREHSSVVAARARTTLSAFFAWALGQGLCEINPVVGTNAPENSKPRERVLSDSELATIWRGSGDGDFGKVVRLCILLGARRSEVGGMAWSELKNLEGPQPCWELPAARSKNRKAHRLPLMPMVLAIIRAVPHLVGRDQLFGSHAAEGFSAWGKAKQALDARCGVGEWTLHDIRRSVATRMADLGVQPHIIEAVLNHVSGHKVGVAGIYNRSSYEREVRNALALWADRVRAIVEGGENKVVNFPQASADMA